MKPFVTVLRREILEHRIFLAAGVLVGLMPLALPWIPGTEGSLPSDLRAGAAAVLSGLLGLAVAVILGGSALTRDLAERRLGFYFSRPLSGAAIWGGKMAAAAIVTLTTTLLVLLPAFLMGDLGGPVSVAGNAGGLARDDRLEAVAGGSVLLLLLLGISHVVSTLLRSRTAWLLLDLIAALVIAGLVTLGWNQISASGARHIAYPLLLAILLALAAGLIAGSLLQVLRGRTDLHAGHRWLSWTLWGVLGLSTLAVTGYTQWLLSAAPEDLRNVLREDGGRAGGSWIYLMGDTRHRLGYRPNFLFDTASGRYVRVRLDRNTGWSLPPQFSDDGARAVWLEGHSPKAPRFLVRADLSGPRPRLYRDPVVLGPDAQLQLSPDGSRLALYNQGRIQIQDTLTGKLQASIAASDLIDPFEFFHFFDNRHLQYFERASSNSADSRRFVELDAATGKVTRTLTLPLVEIWSSQVSPDRNLLLARDYETAQYRLFNLRTGQTLSALPLRPWPRNQEGIRFLADGRVLLSRNRTAHCELRIFAAGTAREVRRFAWNGFDDLWLGGQPTARHLVVTLYSHTDPTAPDWYPTPESIRSRTILLDLETGAARDLPPSTLPLGDLDHAPGSLGARLFQNRQGIVKLDPATWKLTPVLTFG